MHSVKTRRRQAQRTCRATQPSVYPLLTHKSLPNSSGQNATCSIVTSPSPVQSPRLRNSNPSVHTSSTLATPSSTSSFQPTSTWLGLHRTTSIVAQTPQISSAPRHAPRQKGKKQRCLLTPRISRVGKTQTASRSARSHPPTAPPTSAPRAEKCRTRYASSPARQISSRKARQSSPARTPAHKGNPTPHPPNLHLHACQPHAFEKKGARPHGSACAGATTPDPSKTPGPTVPPLLRSPIAVPLLRRPRRSREMPELMGGHPCARARRVHHVAARC